MEKKVTKKEAKEIYLQNGKRIIDDIENGFVVLKDLSKIYDNRVQAVYNFNLSIQKNEFIVLVGPSGCGKSTTLRMIAGIEEITNGKLYIDNVFANYLESKDRDIAMVFQSYALYPNMTVYDNIAFGLQVRHVPKDEIEKRVFHAAKILNIGEYLDRRPKELSGGQMQRVALGRAIVRNAKLFLMDEPLSNLDAKLRVQMRSEIVKLHRDIGATTIYVTHDQTEAMTMADRIVIMNNGFIQQVGTPIEIYNNPSNVFVASFIGSPPMNVFSGRLEGEKLLSDSQFITLPQELLERYKEFIINKRIFFAKLKEQAQLKEEKKLIDSIISLRKNMKKLEKVEVLKTFKSLCDYIVQLMKDKGFVKFTDELQESCYSDIESEDVKAIYKDLVSLEKIIKDSDLGIAAILNEVHSSNVSSAKQEILNKKKKLFKKSDESLQDKNLLLIEEYINSYNDNDILTQPLVGIRPEDIYFTHNFNGNSSEAIKTKADLVELLGSDFCMHVNMFNTNIIVKRNVTEVVKNGEEIHLCVDMNKLKIFDPVSGKTI